MSGAGVAKTRGFGGTSYRLTAISIMVQQAIELDRASNPPIPAK